MDGKRWGVALGLAGALCAAPGDAAASDDPAGPAPARFAEPVRLRAGDRWLGGDRLYPSPVLYDVDGDGVRDVVVADLPGKPTWARATRGPDGAISLAAEKPFLGRDERPLDFSNW